MKTRLPVVQKAIKIFEQETGIIVVAARAYTKGSMRPYVHLRIQVPYEGLFNDHIECALQKKDHYIKDVKITFIRAAWRRKVIPELSEVDIDWKDLGIEYPF